MSKKIENLRLAKIEKTKIAAGHYGIEETIAPLDDFGSLGSFVSSQEFLNELNADHDAITDAIDEHCDCPRTGRALLAPSTEFKGWIDYAQAITDRIAKDKQFEATKNRIRSGMASVNNTWHFEQSRFASMLAIDPSLNSTAAKSLISRS